MYSTTYYKAKSLDDAAKFVSANPDAKLLSGGMTLIPSLKQRLAQPSHLVDIGHLAELRGIEVQGDKLSIGAATKHVEVARSDVVKKAIPALAYLASLIGDPQVRNLGTIGGSLSNNDPAADYPSAALALGATIQTDRRAIAADDFFQGLFSTALDSGEITTRVAFPIPKRAAYQKFAHPASGYAMTGVFVADMGGSIRVGVTGAGPGVFRWKEAEAALARSFTPGALASLSVDASGLNADIHAPAEYRANLVKVMATRAVEAIVGAK